MELCRVKFVCSVLKVFVVHYSGCNVLLWPVNTEIVLYCIVLYCIVLYCIVLYCIVLYCIVLARQVRTWLACDFVLAFVLILICFIVSLLIHLQYCEFITFVMKCMLTISTSANVTGLSGPNSSWRFNL
jgi:hypothetical protein